MHRVRQPFVCLPLDSHPSFYNNVFSVERRAILCDRVLCYWRPHWSRTHISHMNIPVNHLHTCTMQQSRGGVEQTLRLVYTRFLFGSWGEAGGE